MSVQIESTVDYLKSLFPNPADLRAIARAITPVAPRTDHHWNVHNILRTDTGYSIPFDRPGGGAPAAQCILCGALVLSGGPGAAFHATWHNILDEKIAGKEP